MKRVMTARLLLMIILLISTAGCTASVKMSDSISDDLNEIISLYLGGEKEKAAALAENTELCWTRYEKYLTFMVNDEKIEEIGIQISKLKPLIEENSGELLAEANSVRRRINDLRSKEIPAWNNIL